ncbi:protein of unknown function [Petrocella atlantisensis]|uniref:Uncharacterized protein n=1 Tax=Petrocella atlantisensis TaxID=2173034 RepID=A0A3P7PHJ5_9FIRM|nr:protein of unknown function [Petrocella atlantisensis]
MKYSWPSLLRTLSKNYIIDYLLRQKGVTFLVTRQKMAMQAHSSSGAKPTM